MVSQETLDAMTAVIVETLHPEQIILFGSYARNEANEHSDVDLMVVIPSDSEVARMRRKNTGLVSRQLARFKIPTDVLLYTRAEVDQWKDTPTHVIGAGLQEGRILYEHN